MCIFCHNRGAFPLFFQSDNNKIRAGKLLFLLAARGACCKAAIYITHLCAYKNTTGSSPVVFHIFPYYYILLFSQETRYIQRLLLHGAFDIVGFLNADWLKPCLRLSLSALRRDRLLQTHIRRRKRA